MTDYRRPLQATLSAQEIDTALNRTPPPTPWDVALAEGRVVGGVIIPRTVSGGVPVDADDRQIHPPQESAAQPTKPLTRAEQIAILEDRIRWAATAHEYEIAQRSLDRLLAGDVDVRATEQAAADAQAAARIPHGLPIEPLPKARDILIRDPVTGRRKWVKGTPLTKRDLIEIAKLTTRQYAATEPGAALVPGIEPIAPTTIEIKVRKSGARRATSPPSWSTP